MIGLMPLPSLTGKGSWSFLGVLATGSTSIVMPAGLQDNDFGVLLVSSSNSGTSLDSTPSNGSAISTPSGWTLLARLSTQSVGAPTTNGWYSYNNRNGAAFCRRLTASLSGASVAMTSGSASSQLLVFRNSQKRTPLISLLAAVTSGTFPSQTVAFNSAGTPNSPVLAGYALVTGASAAFGTLDGQAWPGTHIGPSTGLSVGFAYDIQTTSRAKTVSNTVSGYHHMIGVGV